MSTNQQSSASEVAGSGSVAADRTLFVGQRIPNEIKKMITLVSGLEKATFRLVLAATTAVLEGKEVNTKELLEKTSKHFTEESLYTVISGLYRLLQLATRSAQTTQKSEILREDLKDMKIPDDFIPDLIRAAIQRRSFIVKHANENGVHLSKLDALKWRVDVGISTSVLNRLLEPSVCMEMVLSNGDINCLEMPLHKFHELRYNVAHVLKELEVLEKRNILKIQD